MSDFDKVKSALLEGLSDERRRVAEVHMNNVEKVIMKEAAGDGGASAVNLGNGDVAKYAKVAFPVIRRVAEALLAQELVNVQPMPGPVGIVRYMDFDYRQDTAAGTVWTDAVTAGDDAIENLYQHYSLAAYADTSYAAVETLAPADQTIHLEHDPGRRMGLKLSNMTIECKSRKLHAHYSLEAEDDAANMYGVSLESELTEVLTNEIVREQDREVLDFIISQGAPSTWDFTSSSGRYHAERFTSLSIKIMELSNEIAVDTKVGPASWIVISPNILTALAHMNVGGFQPAPANVGTSAFVGTLQGNIRVYLDVRAPNDRILIGRRGDTGLEAGIILGSYLPVEMTGVMRDNESFDKILGLRTRYALAATKHAPKYYRVLTVTNLALT